MDSLSIRNRPEAVPDDSTTSIADEQTEVTEKKDEGHAACIKEHRSSLMYYIIFAHGLQDELRPVLTDEQVETIQSELLQSNKIGQLLGYVVDMPLDKQEQFLQALEKTSQKHVANFIRQKGQRATGENSDEWPLLACEAELRSFDTNWSKLIELVDSRCFKRNASVSDKKNKLTIRIKQTHREMNRSCSTCVIKVYLTIGSSLTVL